jgi:transposase-like protein
MEDRVTCPWCSNTNDYDEAFLGVLGFLSHYRCRYCGGNFTSEGDDMLSEQASYFDQGGEA